MVGLALFLWPIPAAWTLLACLVGRGARSHHDRWLSTGLKVLLGVVVLVSLLGLELDAEITSRAALVAGMLVAAGLPTLAFYALGYRVRGPRMTGALWFAATLPLTAYAGFVLYGVMAFTFCAEWGCAGGPGD